MKILRNIILTLLAAYLVLGAIIFAFQRYVIYVPTPQKFSACDNFPGAEKINYQGTRMYIHKAGAQWIIIYHGNAGSACDRYYYLDYFDQKKYSYIVVEYTGYSGAPGHPSQSALLENVRAANDYLKSQDSASVTVIGESLGSALAAYHASIDPPQKLLLISPFDSLVSVGQYHFPFYPINLMLLDKFPSAAWVKNTDNVLVLQGTADTVVPNSSGEALFNEINGMHKQLIKIPGAGHNNIYFNPQAAQAIKNFLAQ